MIDLDFPERANEVIDDLVREQTVQRDWLLDDRNAELLTRAEDMRMEAERRAEVDTLKKLLGLAIAVCLLYTSPSPRDGLLSRMPSSA